MNRQPLTSLDGREFDVIVIGAGINGASSAQHLAAAGYSVLLVDKGDFGSGSTSRSTRMLHCGLRYFETPRPVRDFALAPKKLLIALRMARTSMEIRGELVKDSPERLRPIRMIFPIYRDGPYKPWQLDLAFRILGRFGPRDVPLDYERLPAADCGSLPFIDQMRDRERLHSVATFTEYMFDWPERICMDAVLDAERMGAVVRNHTSAVLGELDAGGMRSVKLTDALDAAATAIARAPVVLNAGGIWIDRVNSSGGAPPRRLIRGTKGAHIVVRLPEACHDHGIATINSVGEPHYVLPSQGGCHHIGPTETEYEGDLDDIRADAGDQDFLLGEMRDLLPGLGVTATDVIYTWAGVRPLGFDAAFPKGKRSVEIHDLAKDGLDAVYAITAGPIMTHRHAGREMVRTVARVRAPSRPATEPDYKPRRFPDNPNSPPLIEGDETLRLSDLAHAATAEHAISLADILIARTGVIYRHRLTNDEIRRAAEAVSTHLRWTEDEMESQIRAFRERLDRLYSPPEAP